MSRNDVSRQDAEDYLRFLPPEGKRRFFAKAAKFFIKSNHWDAIIDGPDPIDHENLHEMILSFNDQNSIRMKDISDPEVAHERSMVGSKNRISKKCNIRVRKRRLRKFAHSFMLLIRKYHRPTNSESNLHRVKCMSRFIKKIIANFLGKNKYKRSVN